MRQPYSVLVFAARNNQGVWEYLLLHRKPNPRLGLGAFWQGITGGLEDGEGVAQTAIRELAEETGLVPSRIEVIDCSYSFPIRDEWKSMYPPGTDRIAKHIFLALADGGVEPTLSEEHDDLKWFDARQGLNRFKYPGNIEALMRCVALLESG